MIKGYIPFTLRGFGGGVVGLVATQAASLLVEASIARRLGATSLGTFAVAMSVATLFGATIIAGCSVAVVRGVSQADHRSDRGAIRGYLILGLGAALLTSVAAMLLVFAVAGTLSDLFHAGADGRTIIEIIALSLPCSAASGVGLAASRALKRIAYDAAGRVIDAAVRLLAVPGLLFFSMGLRDVALIHLFAAAVTVPVALMPVVRRLLDGSVRPSYELREFFSLAGWQGLAAGAWVAARRVDVLTVSAALGPRAAGVYRLATLIAAVGGVVLAALQPMFSPVAARRLVSGGAGQALDHFRRVTRFSALASAPLFAVCLAFPDRLLALFGPLFEGGAVALGLLAIAYAIDSAAGPSTTLLLVSGGAHRAAANMVVGLVAEVVFLVLLVPPLGVAGAALAAGATFLLVNVSQLLAVRRILGGPIIDGAWRRSVMLILALFAAGLAVRAIDLLALQLAAAAFALIVIAYAVAVVRVALPASDRALLMGLPLAGVTRTGGAGS